MLPRGEEECSVNEGVPLEYAHHAVTEDAGDSVHLVGRVARQDEASCLVIANTALILHLDVVGVDL